MNGDNTLPNSEIPTSLEEEMKAYYEDVKWGSPRLVSLYFTLNYVETSIEEDMARNEVNWGSVNSSRSPRLKDIPSLLRHSQAISAFDTAEQILWFTMAQSAEHLEEVQRAYEFYIALRDLYSAHLLTLEEIESGWEPDALLFMQEVLGSITNKYIPEDFDLGDLP